MTCICHEHRPRCTCVEDADLSRRRARYWHGAHGLFKAHRRAQRFFRFLDWLVPGLGSLVRLLPLG